MKTVLLCPPTYFDIEYEINPWMHIQNRVEAEKAGREFQQLKKLYQQLAVRILELPQEKGLPDMVFAANYGYPVGGTFIQSNFKFRQRRKESEFARLFFEKQLGKKVYSLPNDIFFEGQGDLLTDGNRYFFGWGKRSSPLAKAYLEDFLRQEIVDFELVNPYYYHLDTCFAPIGNESVVINTESFTKNSLSKVYQYFSDVIIANKQDNQVLACNLVVVGRNIIIGKGISMDLRNALEDRRFTVHELEMGEFLKSGGSVKCLSLEVFVPDAQPDSSVN